MSDLNRAPSLRQPVEAGRPVDPFISGDTAALLRRAQVVAAACAVLSMAVQQGHYTTPKLNSSS